MPVPKIVAERIVRIVEQLATSAFRGTTLLRKIDEVQVGDYLVKIIRRSTLGRDGAISQMVKIIKNGQKVDIWHLVTKAGKRIHSDVKPIFKKK